jgi:hypothetical protein
MKTKKWPVRKRRLHQDVQPDHRLERAHESLRQMSEYAGRLRHQLDLLRRDLVSRERVILALRHTINDLTKQSVRHSLAASTDPEIKTAPAKASLPMQERLVRTSLDTQGKSGLRVGSQSHRAMPQGTHVPLRPSPSAEV